MSKIEHYGVISIGRSWSAGVCRAALVLLAVMVCGMVVFVAPAVAGQSRLLTEVFGAGTSTPANPYPLSSATGVAVDAESHDVYVVDRKGRRVEKFDSAGHFILMFGKVVDQTTGGDVCTAASGDTCQAGVSGSSPGAFEEPEWVAVDNSGAFGQQGDVYVTDTQAGLVTKFNPEGEPISGWGNNGEGHAKDGPPNGQLNGANLISPVAGPFGQVGSNRIGGVAVDHAGNLWVESDHAVFEFRAGGIAVSDWPALNTGVSESGLSLDSLDNVYLAFHIAQFPSNGQVNIPELASGFALTMFEAGSTTGSFDVAVDQVSNELYAAVNSKIVDRFDPSSCHLTGLELHEHCTPAEQFGALQLTEIEHFELAVDPLSPGDTVYVAADKGNAPFSPRVLAFPLQTVPDVVTSKAGDFTAGTATLIGTIDPSGVELLTGTEGCRFEWGEHGVGEPEPYGHTVPCDKMAAQIGSGTSPVEVHATIAGLQQGRTYHFRLVAANHNQITELVDEPSLGSDLAFGPPSIESASPITVGASDAKLQVQVNPNNVDTRVRVEYGTEVGVYGHSSVELDLGSGGTSQLASFQLSGLSPGMTYHYRFVAENALGEGPEAILSSDRVFETQLIVSGSGLLDGRGWEMVSPPDKRGAEPAGISESTGPYASSTGNAVAYLTKAATENEPAGSPGAIQVLSRRTAGGWVSRDIALPHEAPTGAEVGIGAEYRFFSSDLSSALVQPSGPFLASLSVEASEQTPYIRTDFVGGDLESPCLSECFRPLVTGAPGHENVPPETVFAPCRKGSRCGPEFLGASSDLNHVVLTSSVPLIEGAPAGPAGQVGSSEGSLYEWANGMLSLISVLPNGQPAPGRLALGYSGVRVLARNTISADGSRVVWSNEFRNLYVRDVAREETVQINSGAAEFQVANSNVSKIVFIENGDLRECAIVEDGEGKIHCETSDLSPVGVGESPGILGTIPGASGDGSYVYFVANGVLKNGGVPVPGARPGGCMNEVQTVTGVTCNLYVSHNGVVRLVAEVSDEDSPDWGSLPSLTARVSPSGRWFAFMSDRSLTGYDNRDNVSGKLDEEVYLYDAAASSGEGGLVCVSCNPTGARPHGAEINSGKLNSPNSFKAGNRWLAAIIPGWTSYRLGTALYQSRFLSDSGRLFFNSADALVPQDSNGTGDVYEFEPSGVGDCTTASVMFSVVSGGCVGLVSSGTAGEPSEFMDASEDGNDVFFLTGAQLSRTDTDKALDVYDARIGGGFPEASPPPTCEGDACQSPVSAPEDPTPGSLTYQGPGNQTFSSTTTVSPKQKVKILTRPQKLARALNACKRDRTRRARAACIRNARKRYGPARGGKASMKRGGR